MGMAESQSYKALLIDPHGYGENDFTVYILKTLTDGDMMKQASLVKIDCYLYHSL